MNIPSIFYFIFTGLKFLVRNPEKIYIFTRDLAIPIILIISVTSIIASFNNNIIFLSSLAGQDSYLALREDNSNLEESFIPFGLEKEIQSNKENVIDTLSINQINLPLKVREPYQNVNLSTESVIIGTNLSKLADFWGEELQVTKSINTSSLTNTSGIIGEKLANSLNIVENNLPVDFFIELKDEGDSYLYLQVVSILKGETMYTNSILTPRNFFYNIKSIYQTHSNYLLIKTNKTSNIDIIKQTINDNIKKAYPDNNFLLISARGTTTLLDNILFEIIDKLRIFNLILIFLILIRLFQAVQWLSVHYELDFAYLKIIGQKRYEILIIVLIMGQTIGNLALLLALPISILLPHGISLLLALVTNQVFIPEIPNIFQLVELIITFNIIFIIVCLFPAIQISFKPIRESIVRK
ncbi:MAG: hypothetical protein ACW98A_09705 [Candidatus Hodarchaeales archaeon]|jgi:hypothetical protein